MAYTRSLFYLFLALCSTVHCYDTQPTQTGLPTQLTQANHGKIQIYNVLYPPQSGLIDQPNCHCSTDETWYLIRNPRSGYAIEAGVDKRLTMQTITNNDQQLWRFEPVGKPGLYYIINKRSGEVLEAPEDELAWALTAEKSGSARQQWLLDTHGRFYNGARDQNLDIIGGDFSVGVRLQLHDNNGNAAQVFWLHKVEKEGGGVEKVADEPVEEAPSDEPVTITRRPLMPFIRFG